MKLITYPKRQKNQTVTECLGFLCKTPSNTAPAASWVLPSLSGCRGFLCKLSESCPGASALAVPSAWSSASPFAQILFLLPQAPTLSSHLKQEPPCNSQSLHRFWPFQHLSQ